MDKEKMDKENDKVIKAYKGFNQDFKCRDMQYEVGKEYEYDGEIQCCKRGYHACENPLDVLDYYNLTDSRFAKVELSGDIDKDNDSKDTKLCASKIAVKAELKLADFIKLSVEHLKELVRPKDNDEDKGSGYGSKLASSGDRSQLASSGDESQLASSGDRSKLASSGDRSQLASSGDESQLASSGYRSQLASSGYRSVVMNAGISGIAKAKKGSWITLAEWDYEPNQGVLIPVCVKTEKVDGERIKEDTWYRLEDGEFKEVAK